jgi:hypothetical protein
MSREYHILNLGAGVQSTTLYLMSMAGEIQKFDVAIFADTQEEPQGVYKHLEWLKSLDGPPILVRTAGKLGDDLIIGQNTTHHRFLSIPCYTKELGTGAEGMGRRQCSHEYKVRVIDRAVRHEVLGLKPGSRIPKNTNVYQYFGISWDERSRASRIWERFHIDYSTRLQPRFPLVDRQWTRANCLDYLAGKVPHSVPKSACVFCPFRDDAGWQQMKDEAGPDWNRAVEIDIALRVEGCAAARRMRSTLYVHETCQPLTQVEFRPRTNPKELQLGFGVECEGVCGV